MIKKILVSIFAVTGVVIAFSFQSNPVHTSTNGAPAGHTGSPADGNTCSKSGCHTGTVPIINGAITSNVPVTGYVPGSVYSFSASISQSSITKFGFQASPQSVTGVYQGTLIVTDATGTQIVGTKYITHKSAGTSGSGSKTWTFDWKAPAAGTGTVSFYAAFNATNSGNNATGDQIYKSKLDIAEDLTAGIKENSSISKITLFPNPATSQINISTTIAENQKTTISVYDINGKLITVLFNDFTTPGRFSRSYNISGILNAGTYFIMIENSNQTNIEKFVVVTEQ